MIKKLQIIIIAVAIVTNFLFLGAFANTNETLRWNFNKDGDNEGWLPENDLIASTKGGSINLQSTGSDPYMYSKDGLNIDLADIEGIKVHIKNNDSEIKNLDVFFITNDSYNFSESKKYSFRLDATNEYTDVVIDTKKNKDWVGTLKRLRFDTGTKPGSVSIDYISVVKNLSLAMNAEVEANDYGFEFTDISSKPQNEAVKTLFALGLIEKAEDTLFKPNDFVTRAEMASYIVKITGNLAEDFGLETSFYDVPLGHRYINEINYVSKMGYMGGYSSDRFAPDEPITYEQAIKILVKVLGYEIYAQQKGGYPFGYIAVANQNKLMNNITISKELTRGDMAILLYNALDIDLLRQVEFGEKSNYETTLGVNLASEYLKIYNASGKLTGTNETKLTAKSNLNDFEVLMADTIYNIGKTDAKKYLGYTVKLYYKETENDEKQILYIREYPNRNKTLIIQADDLCVDDAEYSFENIIYKVGETEKKVEMASEFDVIYNGEAITNYLAKYIKPSSGYIKLIDNNSDGKYDVVFTVEYDNYVVLSVDVAEGKIYDKFGKSIVIDVKDSSKKITLLDQDDNPFKINFLKEWDVLSVAKSESGTVIKAYLSKSTITGRVNEKYEDDKTYIVFQNDKYLVAKSYKNSTHSDAREIAVGDRGIFYLDVEYKIAAVDLSIKNSKKYGFLVKVEVGKGLLAEEAKFRIFNSSGAFITLNTANRVILNGQAKDLDGKYYTGSSIKNASVFKNSSNENFIPQLIQYKQNKMGEIIELDTAVSSNRIGYLNNEFSLDATLENVIYKNGQRSFDYQYLIDENTIIYLVPKANQQGELEEEKFSIGNFASFVHDKFYSIKVYDAINTKVAGVIVTEVPLDSYNYIPNVFIVDKITESVDEYGENTKMLYGYSKGSKVKYYIENLGAFAGIKQGDCIQISLDYNGRIDQVRKLFDILNDKNTYIEKPVLANEELTTFYGITYAVRNKVLTLTMDNGISIKPFLLNTNTNIYLYNENSSSNKISISSINEIMSSNNDDLTGSKLFIYKRYDQIPDIVIIKGVDE